MGKAKKLYLVILLTLIINDVCLYIRHLSSSKPHNIISFDLIVTRFDSGIVVNYSIIFVLFISFIYFVVNFFKSDNK